jgi:hypothetical protein
MTPLPGVVNVVEKLRDADPHHSGRGPAADRPDGEFVPGLAGS